MKQLIEIAKEILKINPKAALSGSLALNIQKVKTMREPSDIDVYMPYFESLSKIDGMVINTNTEDEDYCNPYYERQGYLYNSIKIDVFMPLGREFNLPQIFSNVDGVRIRP